MKDLQPGTRVNINIGWSDDLVGIVIESGNRGVKLRLDYSGRVETYSWNQLKKIEEL